MAQWSGPLLVLVFGLSQAFRDVYFGGVFQRVDFFAVILIAFVCSTAIFGALVAIRTPGELAKLRGQRGAVLGMNLFTALAWSNYFFSLTYVEPSVANTVHSAMGPLTVVVLGRLGLRIAKPGRLGLVEALSYGAVALTVAALWWIVLSGRSGLAAHGPAALALGAVMVSGASITVSLLYSKRLHDVGVNAEAVTATRYLLLIAVALAVEFWRGRWTGFSSPAELSTLAGLSTALMVLPLFALQVGVARTAPLTAQVIRALGPVFIFALEQFDGRTRYAPAVLAAIVAYSAAIIVGNVAHGWRDAPHGSESTKAASSRLKRAVSSQNGECPTPS